MSNGGNLNLTHEQMRSLIIEALRSGRAGSQFADLRTSIAQAIAKMQVAPTPLTPGGSVSIFGNRHGDSLSPTDYARVLSIMWDLIIEGVIRPGLNDGLNNNIPHFHVTEWGERVLKEGPATPYDPDGYMDRLRRDVADIDPVIITYLNESLHTFRIGCLLSSTIALGCASEKAILLLIAAYAESLPQAMKDKFKANTDYKVIKRQFDEMRKMIDSELRARLPGDLADGLDVELNAIFDFIRNQRNDAGHPTGKIIERERAYANLVVFPVYLKKVYSLVEWVTANPKT